MDALVHNSFITDCVCPHRCSHSILRFIPFPLHASFPPSLFSLHLPLSIPPSLAPLLHHYHLHLTHYLPLSICPFLWNKTWIHYSFIQTYLSSPRAYLQTCFLLCLSYSRLVRSLLKTPQHWGVFFSGASTDKSGSWGSKNPFRGFSCHNNSSASLK